MERRKGFTLVELMIVVCLLAFISAIGGLMLHNYTLNRNLRTAARDIVSDFTIFKERAVSENITYQIAFDTTLPGSYTIQSVVNAVVTNLTTKRPSSFGSGIRIISATFGPGASQTVIFSPRGTVSPLGNGVLDGVVLQNSRNSQATITVNLTGRTYVTFIIV
ncbi:MAG: prepilin-type N-terminal cleavage/methylation domain-containing protein [Syntrophales bacterium]|jgi:prepilin-type N-terminal cleavage/methylation domain-containing protein